MHMNNTHSIEDQRMSLKLLKNVPVELHRISSSRIYDRALSSIFPYHVRLSHEAGQELSGLISRGHHEPFSYYPSFALVMDFTGGPSLSVGGKVLWLSEAAYTLLTGHEDLYRLEVEDYTVRNEWLTQ